MVSSNQYLLQTARLGMRRWKPSDLEVFTAMNQDPEVRKYFPQLLTPAESAESIARLEAFFDEHGFTFYAVDVLAGAADAVDTAGATDAGMFIGFVGLYRPNFDSWFTPCVEIGWRLRREAWGHGYATEAATECLRFGLEDLGLERIYSFTAAPNVRSARVMQKIGMRFAGEFDHPRIEEGHWLRRQVLYEATGGQE
jgi:[ribosomal protein S5]-alanine N-acetyltransferase